MATTITTARSTTSPGDLVRRDRLFYSGMAFALALIVLIGFAPTYYLRAFSDGPSSTINGLPFTGLVRLHGVLFSGWVVLFLVQTTLIANRRVKLHQRLGIAGGLFAAAMIVVGVATAVEAAARGSAPPGIDPLAFLAIPIGDITLFTGFIGAALWNRRNKEAHKRLMLLAYVSILTAAVARLPGVLPLGPLGFYGLTFIVLVVAIAYDYWSRGRVHPAYMWGSALVVLAVPARLVISGTSVWRSFAQLLTT